MALTSTLSIYIKSKARKQCLASTASHRGRPDTTGSHDLDDEEVAETVAARQGYQCLAHLRISRLSRASSRYPGPH